jgi:hypothetical protein
MNTVKEFNSAGLIAVKGDYIGHPTKANCTEKMVYVAEPEYIMAANEYKDYSFKSFAWRTNTGVKPEFNGEIECLTSNGCYRFAYTTYVNFGDSHGGKPIVIKWRPHLAQSKQTVFDVDAHVSDASKVKPVFTQAMADAGELPPVGSDFKVDGDQDCDDGYCHMRCVAHHIDGGVIGQDDLARMFWILTGAIPIDTRTDKEKAVDEMMKIIDDQRTHRGACGIIYDMLKK